MKIKFITALLLLATLLFAVACSDDLNKKKSEEVQTYSEFLTTTLNAQRTFIQENIPAVVSKQDSIEVFKFFNLAQDYYVKIRDSKVPQEDSALWQSAVYLSKQYYFLAYEHLTEIRQLLMDSTNKLAPIDVEHESQLLFSNEKELLSNYNKMPKHVAIEDPKKLKFESVLQAINERYGGEL